ncbi:IS3 family transposase [Bacillus sp. S14(2024)]|uniref:IS3 family transposase n=1 Tax=Bacillus sp. S14(2024) TaxID=3162884 RepID=UPI003D1DB2AA
MVQGSKNKIEEIIKRVCLCHKPCYGYQRITAALRKMRICINHKNTHYETPPLIIKEGIILY